jgi:hypothetical protein
MIERAAATKLLVTYMMHGRGGHGFVSPEWITGSSRVE